MVVNMINHRSTSVVLCVCYALHTHNYGYVYAILKHVMHSQQYINHIWCAGLCVAVHCHCSHSWHELS